jgi:SAM-dependent methyltransferase
MMNQDAVTEVNKRAYHAQSHVRGYDRTAGEGALRAERLALDALGPSPRGSVLDIGVGAGRTIPVLSSMFRNYVGIDYSEPLVAAARRRFPATRLEVMDARTMHFAEKFDCIVFSYNGIDYVPRADRIAIFANVAAYLTTGGMFVYSTHNLFHRRVADWLNSFWVRELVSPVRQLRFLPRRLANFGKQAREDGFAYINDPGLGFSLLTAYVDIDAEASVLRQLGLETIAHFGCGKNDAVYDEQDSWAYVIAKKCAL